MMDIRELRIGNLVEYQNWIPHLVSAVDIMHFENHPNAYKPIPLTEEILINAGFKVGYPGCRFNDWEVEFAYGKYLGKHLEADKLYLAVNSAEYHISDIPIEYLHQLQNIVFDLTKKEIEFKI